MPRGWPTIPITLDGRTYRLGRMEYKLLRLLLARDGWVTTGQIMDHLHGDNPDPPYQENVWVIVCRIRKKFDGTRLRIENRHGNNADGGGWRVRFSDEPAVQVLTKEYDNGKTSEDANPGHQHDCESRRHLQHTRSDGRCADRP